MPNSTTTPLGFLNKSLTSSVTTSSLPVSPVVGFAVSGSLRNNTKHITDSASLVTLTLPATSNVGDVIWVLGSGAGGWKIAQNPLQIIHAATNTTTGTAGSVASNNRYDSIELVCIVANKEFTAQSVKGSLTIA